MIKITKDNTTKTISILDETYKITHTILGSDISYSIFDEKDVMFPTNTIRTITIFNKYTFRPLATFDTNSLDPTSVSYSSNMDTYYTSLRTVFYS